MAQLTNTRIYGTLDVDNVITAKNGINVTPLKNSTDSKDNSAKITLNSVIVDNKQDSTKNENKLSSIMLSTLNTTVMPVVNDGASAGIKKNTTIYHNKYAEMENNFGENNSGELFSLDLKNYTKTYTLTTTTKGTPVSKKNEIDDITYKILLSVYDGNVRKAIMNTTERSAAKKYLNAF